MHKHAGVEAPLLPLEDDTPLECEVCEDEVEEDSLVHLDTGKLSDLLKEYHIYSICTGCHHGAKTLYQSDIEGLAVWLKENDNREHNLTLSDDRKALRKGFRIDISLLAEDPEEYYSKLDKYASTMEETLIWLMDRYNLDVNQVLADFKRHKVKML